MNTYNKFQILEGQKEETIVQKISSDQRDNQNKVTTKIWVEEKFGKDSRGQIDKQQKEGEEKSEGHRPQESNLSKSIQIHSQEEDHKPTEDKGEVEASNQNTGSEEDHHSTARKK